MAFRFSFFKKSEDANIGPAKDDRADIVVQCRRKSADWLRENYWDECEEAFQNYKCKADPFFDPNDETKIDESQTAVAMPDTWGIVRRFVARVTAQPPSHRFMGDDPDLADRITRSLMYQWDKSGKQRVQKKHVLQAAIFGWSVQAWHWAIDESKRKRRIDPMDPNNWEAVKNQYQSAIFDYQQQMGIPDIEMLDPQSREEARTAIASKLIEDSGRGTLVPISYLYKCYEGPRAEFLFIGDCYPEPHFASIQSSNWFIVDRRRNLKWFTNFIRAYGAKYPDIVNAINDMITDLPKGTPKNLLSTLDNPGLRERLLNASGRTDTDLFGSEIPSGPEWTVTEKHCREGDNLYLDLVGEGQRWIGRIEYPYELENQFAFTELVFIDDLLAGFGDSVARIVRPLNKLHNRQVSKREDLIYNLLRPLYVTADQNLYENPEQLKRASGFRLVYSQRGVSSVNESPALASAAASYNDEGGLARMFQLASGETNLSMAANVDPQQARTATGAKIMAFNGDILTREQVDMLTLAVRDDLEIMRLLNRSEMTEPIEVNAEQYRLKMGGQYEQPPDAGLKSKATPEDFQYDGEIQVEIGSTLADDDDTKLSRAQMLFQSATAFPQLINPEEARNELLTALGKGKDLAKWIPQPQPPPPQEVRTSLSFSAKLEEQAPQVQIEVLTKAGIIDPNAPPQPQPPQGIGPMRPLPDQQAPPMPPPETQIEAGTQPLQ